MKEGSSLIKEELSKLEEKRKKGEIGVLDFYHGLLRLVGLLAEE